MQRSRIERVIREVADYLGVQLALREASSPGHDFELRLVNYSEPRGFVLGLSEDYLAWVGQLSFDEFSKPLLMIAAEAYSQNREATLQLKNSLESLTDNYSVMVNKQPLDLETNKFDWENFEVVAMKAYSGDSDPSSALSSVIISALSLPLLLLSSSPDQGLKLGEKEGAVQQHVFSKHERSRLNRAICLSVHGFACSACGHTLSDFYGDLASQVIHVHHTTPVSQMTESTRVDPVHDLVPLCPNCHNVVHTKNPPIAVEELRDKIRANSTPRGTH